MLQKKSRHPNKRLKIQMVKLNLTALSFLILLHEEDDPEG